MKIGCYALERLTGQEVLVSIEANLGDKACVEHDTDTPYVDYGILIDAIREALEDKEIKLVESVVLTLGKVLMGRFEKMEHLEVWIEKPILPNGVGKGSKVSVSQSFTR